MEKRQYDPRTRIADICEEINTKPECVGGILVEWWDRWIWVDMWEENLDGSEIRVSFSSWGGDADRSVNAVRKASDFLTDVMADLGSPETWGIFGQGERAEL